MIRFQHVRVAARIWLAVNLLAAFGLIVFSMNSHAGWFDKPPQTETGSGGGVNPGHTNYVTQDQRNKPGAWNAENFIDFDYSARVLNEINSGQRVILTGREETVRDISNGLDDLKRTVALVKTPKAGGTSAVDQFIFMNPTDTVVRVKTEEFAKITNPAERARVMAEVLQLVEARTRNTVSPGRTVLYVDNLGYLNIGEVTEPKASQAIVNEVARGTSYGLLLETDGPTIKKIEESNPGFKASLKKVFLNRPEIRMVVNNLRGIKDKFERDLGVHIPENTLVEAARLAVRYWSTDAFNRAQQLLKIAAREMRASQTGSPEAVVRLKQDIAQIDLEISSLRTDLAVQPDAQKQGRLESLEREKATLEEQKKGFLKLASTDVGGPTIAGLQAEIEDLKLKQRELQLRWYERWSQKGAASRAMETQIREKSEQLAQLKNETPGSPSLRNALKSGFVQLAAAWEASVDPNTVALDANAVMARIEEINNELFDNEERVERVKQRMGAWLLEQEEREKKAIEERTRPSNVRVAVSEERTRPIMSVLTYGPTGTAKTDLALNLAKTLGMPAHVISMTNYTQSHHASGLIGGKPEYAGYGKDGELTGPVLKTPYILIVLDEITRAHLEVLQTVVYPILDLGYIRDSQGQLVMFDKAIIWGTTNAGEQIARMPRPDLLKFLEPLEHEWTANDIAGKTDDELRNRAFEWILKTEYQWEESMVGRFNIIEGTKELSLKTVERIVHKNMRKLAVKFGDKMIKLRLSFDAVDALIRQYDPTKGGRSVINAIDALRDRIYSDFVYGRVKPGQNLVVSSPDGKNIETMAVEPVVMDKALAEGNRNFDEGRSRIQELMAKKAAAGETPKRSLTERLFDEKFMIRNSVMKILRSFGRE